jgi:GT2 family glycosyltransferase
MIDISFIITVHSKRIDNLKQTLRFLAKREAEILSISELIVVCQDRIELENTDFAQFRLINLEMPHYCMPIMNNRGAEIALGKTLVFLDSDRIMPVNWYKSQISALKFDSVISAQKISKHLCAATDAEIEESLPPYLSENRISNMGLIGENMGLKSVFSGNTIISKATYLDMGGMDESFVGYGFSDTDMSYKLYKAGIKIILTQDEELHLWHTIDDLAEFKSTNFSNALKFCRKWNVVPSIHWKKLWQAYHSKVLQ